MTIDAPAIAAEVMKFSSGNGASSAAFSALAGLAMLAAALLL